jgi:hypothetical protein
MAAVLESVLYLHRSAARTRSSSTSISSVLEMRGTGAGVGGLVSSSSSAAREIRIPQSASKLSKRSVWPPIAWTSFVSDYTSALHDVDER